MEKKMISISPSQNTGTDMPKKLNAVDSLSISEYCFLAETMR